MCVQDPPAARTNKSRNRVRSFLYHWFISFQEYFHSCLLLIWIIKSRTASVLLLENQTASQFPQFSTYFTLFSCLHKCTLKLNLSTFKRFRTPAHLKVLLHVLKLLFMCLKVFALNHLQFFQACDILSTGIRELSESYVSTDIMIRKSGF